MTRAVGRDARRAIRARMLLLVCFTLYLLLLVWAVLFKLDLTPGSGSSPRVLKLIPFVATTDAAANAPFEVAMNVVLFVPFGIYLGVVAPARAWLWRVAVIAATSLGLEVAQYTLAVGRSDATDLVANTAGGALGLAIAMVVRRWIPLRALACVGAIATAVVAVLTAVFVLTPLHFGPMSGVIPDDVTGRLPRVDGRQEPDEGADPAAQTHAWTGAIPASPSSPRG